MISGIWFHEHEDRSLNLSCKQWVRMWEKRRVQMQPPEQPWCRSKRKDKSDRNKSLSPEQNCHGRCTDPWLENLSPNMRSIWSLRLLGEWEMIHLCLKSGAPCLVGSKSGREKLKKPFKVTKITPHKEGTEGRWTATLGRRRVGAKGRQGGANKGTPSSISWQSQGRVPVDS